MTRVSVIVEEVFDWQKWEKVEQAENLILHIPVREFDQGVQFGETSEAVSFAQKLVKAAVKIKG